MIPTVKALSDEVQNRRITIGRKVLYSTGEKERTNCATARHAHSNERLAWELQKYKCLDEPRRKQSGGARAVRGPQSALELRCSVLGNGGTIRAKGRNTKNEIRDNVSD